MAALPPVRALGTGGGYNSDINDAVRWAAGLPVSGVPANPTPARAGLPGNPEEEVRRSTPPQTLPGLLVQPWPRVISLSLGGDGACDQASQEAIDAARPGPVRSSH